MAAGDLTCSTPVYVDVNEPAAIKAAIDDLNLAATTDLLFCIPTGNGQRLCIFKVERAAS